MWKFQKVTFQYRKVTQLEVDSLNEPMKQRSTSSHKEVQQKRMVESYIKFFGVLSNNSPQSAALQGSKW